MISIVEIYADILYFLLFMADYVLLKLLGCIMKKRTKELRVVLGAFAGSFLSLIVQIFLPQKAGIIGLVPIGIVMLVIAFPIKDAAELAGSLVMLFLCSALMGGACAFFCPRITGRGTYLAVSLLGMLWFLYLFARKGFGIMKEFLLHRSQNTEVCLKVQGRKAYCKGFWDSGNSLKDPITGKAVVLLEKSILEKYKIPIPVKGFRVIPFHSVGMENGVLKGFVADELLVYDEKGYERCFRKIVVAIYEGRLSLKEEYQMILSPHL